MESLTSEQIQKIISATYDSVGVINDLQSKTSLTEEEQDELDRNIQHIRIMMGHAWFVELLSTDQIVELQAI